MRKRNGQATLEFVISYVTILLPVTMMIVFTANLLWVWHGVIDWTREGARYASTHCWQGDGANVRTFMQQNVPLMFDRDQFAQGPAEITIGYFSKNADSGAIEDFTCDGGECSRSCIPDVVKITVAGYEFRSLFTFLGLPPVPLPNVQTVAAIESAGCNPDTEDCLP
jgi:hypothetical protein